MLFVTRYTQPVKRMGVLPLTSVVPRTFSSTGHHSSYNSPLGELPRSMLCASLHTSLPCPSHLHPSVRLHNTGLWRKRQKYLVRHIPWSCWGCQNMELTGLCFMTSWMFQSSPSQTLLLFCSFLLLSATEAWEVKPSQHTATTNVTLERKS